MAPPGRLQGTAPLVDESEQRRGLMACPGSVCLEARRFLVGEGVTRVSGPNDHPAYARMVLQREPASARYLSLVVTRLRPEARESWRMDYRPRVSSLGAWPGTI